MADISYSVNHHLSHADAKKAAQTIADNLSREYDLTCTWNGDVLNFARSGVKGSLTVTNNAATIEINLSGMMMSLLRGKIESQVTAKMQQVFTA